MIQVAMGLIQDREGRFLIAKRNKNKQFGGLWEFPGGKIEAGESPSGALIREIQEELCLEIKPLREYSAYIYSEAQVSIQFFPVYAHLVTGDPILNEHEAYAFVKSQAFSKYEFAPGDYQAIELIYDELD